MTGRRFTVYVPLPEEISSKNAEAKATVSFNLVLPKSFEKASQKFMEKQADIFSENYKKFLKKQLAKHYDE